MRELKFRVWDKQDKRMITHEQEFIPLKVTNIGVLRLDPCIKEDRWMLIDEDRFEIMQYTGLKDKNEAEIYEGDICKLIILGDEEKYRFFKSLLHVIEWDKGCWGFRPLYPELVHEDDRKWTPFYDNREMWDNKYFECIGNIHENHELLSTQ